MISEKTQRRKKKQKKTIYQPPSSFSSLPDDITENILARVSRWNYPSLSLVSKRFRSLLSSMQIYKTRSQIGAQETCAYVCLELRNHPYPSWFSLWTKPNQTLTKQEGRVRFKKDSSGNSVVPTPFSASHSPPITEQSNLEVGSEIYIIGGPCKEEPSSSVRILDCRNHTWRDGPRMTVARGDASAEFTYEKIYVMGGCDIDKYSENWIEVFDMKTQSWTTFPGPGADEEELRNLIREGCDYSIIEVFEGKLYVDVGEKEYACELKDGTWKLVREQSCYLFKSLASWCEIENVIYCCTFSGDLMWLDSKTEVREWREIKGLEKLRKHRTRGLRTGNEFDIDNFGGKLLVMWDVSDNKPKNKIRYAKISLESRCDGGEVWGNVECVDKLTFPVDSYESFRCLTVSV